MGGGSDAGPTRLRDLPAVHELAATLAGPPALATAAARRAIEERRQEILAGTNHDGAARRRATAPGNCAPSSNAARCAGCSTRPG